MPDHSEPWKIRVQDRLTACGKTRSGKTTAVKKLVWDALHPVIFWDVKKQESDDLNAPVLTSIEQAEEALFPDDPSERVRRFVFRGDATIETLERLCEMVYKLGNQHLIVDELLSLYDSTSMGHWHKKLTVEGAGRDAGITNCTQRPKGVPMASLSEAEHILCFYLRQPDDRDRMADLCGELDGEAIKRLDRYQFVYDHESFRQSKICDPLDI